MTKTNAIRLLEQVHISFRTMEYPVDEQHLDGIYVAQKISMPPEQLFKTLVVKGEKKGILVCCIPVNKELDLKKAATAIKDKKIEMLVLKELLNTTGYIRGGCSPIGMKKKYPTFFDKTVLQYDEIGISAGVRGMQIFVNPNVLIPYIGANVFDLIKDS